MGLNSVEESVRKFDRENDDSGVISNQLTGFSYACPPYWNVLDASTTNSTTFWSKLWCVTLFPIKTNQTKNSSNLQF